MVEILSDTSVEIGSVTPVRGMGSDNCVVF